LPSDSKGMPHTVQSSPAGRKCRYRSPSGPATQLPISRSPDSMPPFSGKRALAEFSGMGGRAPRAAFRGELWHNQASLKRIGATVADSFDSPASAAAPVGRRPSGSAPPAPAPGPAGLGRASPRILRQQSQVSLDTRAGSRRSATQLQIGSRLLQGQR
jgi:hypothetical protein